MSFKRKTVTLTSNSSRTPVPRPGVVPGVRGIPTGHGDVPATTQRAPVDTKNILQHCGVRPSTQMSVPTISTGSSSLDDVLGHTGLPLGSVLLIEESGNTEFANVILRSFAAIGVVQSRVSDKSIPNSTSVICLGTDDSWSAELPGIYMDKKEKAKVAIEKDKAKVTVGNLANDLGERKSNMKIAWRYTNTATSGKEQGPDLSSKPFYTTSLDFKSRMRPLPSPTEIKTIAFQGLQASSRNRSIFQSVLERLNSHVEEAIKKSPETVVRVIVPSFLHPAIYLPECFASGEIVQFVYSLVCLGRKYPQNLAIIMSLSLELYPRELPVVKWIENLVDGLIHIDPFPDKMDSLSSEAPSDSTTSKPYQGLVNVYKLPMFSERGQMVVRRGELAFRVSRKSFEIDEWGIPVEDAEAPKTVSAGSNSGEIDVNKATSTSPPVDLSKLDF